MLFYSCKRTLEKGSSMSRPRLLTRDQVAKLLGVSRKSVHNWTIKDELPLRYIKINSTYRYWAEDVEKFMQEHTHFPNQTKKEKPDNPPANKKENIKPESLSKEEYDRQAAATKGFFDFMHEKLENIMKEEGLLEENKAEQKKHTCDNEGMIGMLFTDKTDTVEKIKKRVESQFEKSKTRSLYYKTRCLPKVALFVDQVLAKNDTLLEKATVLINTAFVNEKGDDKDFDYHFLINSAKKLVLEDFLNCDPPSDDIIEKGKTAELDWGKRNPK